MKKNSIFMIVGGIIIAILSFIGGMQYKTYQFASAVKEAFSGISQATSHESPVDNSPKLIDIEKGKAYTFDNGMQLNVNMVETGVKEYKDPAFTYINETYKAKNEFIVITLFGENTGKEPKFQSLSNAQLKLSDGTTYNSYKSIQLPKRYEGRGGCFECNTNPGEKAAEDLLFDIPTDKSIDGAKVIVDGVAFGL